jgi:hypothetical protein
MLKVDQITIDRMEKSYSGIAVQISEFEAAELPHCSHCESANTADVQVGLIQRTINLTAATTKFRLVPNGPKPGRYFCNDCNQYFGDIRAPKTSARQTGWVNAEYVSPE